MLFKNKKVICTEDMKNIKMESTERVERVKEVLSCISGKFEISEYDVLVTETTYTYRIGSLIKPIQLKSSPITTSKKEPESLKFRTGTKLVFVKEVDDRRERGLKPLYSFILPHGERFPFYEEEFNWTGEESETVVERTVITKDRDKDFYILDLGNKKSNKEMFNKLSKKKNINAIFSEEELRLINKYIEEPNVDEMYVPQYFNILETMRAEYKTLRKKKASEEQC